MKLKINGKELNYGNPVTVTELLIDRKVKMPDMVSVELNGKILRRSAFEDTVLNDGDHVEFLYFMGGGVWN
ncbi:MAG: sulfur carrier protein ThiS [Spirochaetes bacterium]|nr:sulfur carrier protein ThiS [Spirochaetota bacterium]